MSKDKEYTPLFHWDLIVNGLLGGSLVVGGIVSPFGILTQVILLLMGIFIFVDSIIRDGEVSIVATVISAIVGGFISLSAITIGFFIPWMGAVVVVTIIIFIINFSKRRQENR